MTPARRLPYWLFGALIATMLQACASPPAPPAPVDASPTSEMLTAGAQIAQAQCGACHNTTESGSSPLPGAPEFRTISARYRLDVLREELQQGVHVGAAEMPKFALTLAEIDALSAYLDSIQEEPKSSPLSIK